MINYTELTEEEFQEHCTALYAEQNRRARIRDIPNDIKKMAQDFESLGGTKEDLITKINEPAPVVEEVAETEVPETPVPTEEGEVAEEDTETVEEEK